MWVLFGENVCKNERIGSHRGWHAPSTPPPPRSANATHIILDPNVTASPVTFGTCVLKKIYYSNMDYKGNKALGTTDHIEYKCAEQSIDCTYCSGD